MNDNKRKEKERKERNITIRNMGSWNIKSKFRIVILSELELGHNFFLSVTTKIIYGAREIEWR